MDFSTLTQYLDSLQKCGIPACEMHVYHKGREVYAHAAGYSDAKGTKKADFSDLYRLYSCTKVLTSTCVFQLIEKGLINLDDPVSKYLPEYATLTVKTDEGERPAATEMKIRHLLTMTGGLSYNFNTPAINEAVKNNANTRDFVAAIAKGPLQFDPGASYEYSLCHDVLGAVIEVASGMRLGEYMAKNIFQPLGMESATLDQYTVDNARMTQTYVYDQGHYKANPIENYTNNHQPTPNYESGGASGICTASDYGKFAGAMANGGVSADGYRLLSQQTIDIMRSPQLNDVQLSRFNTSVGKPGYNYGYGVRTLTSREIGQSLSPIGEFGWDGMGGCYTLIDTDNQIGIFFAMQVVGCGYCYCFIHPMLRNLTYKALL